MDLVDPEGRQIFNRQGERATHPNPEYQSRCILFFYFLKTRMRSLALSFRVRVCVYFPTTKQARLVGETWPWRRA